MWRGRKLALDSRTLLSNMAALLASKQQIVRPTHNMVEEMHYSLFHMSAPSFEELLHATEKHSCSVNRHTPSFWGPWHLVVRKIVAARYQLGLATVSSIESKSGKALKSNFVAVPAVNQVKNCSVCSDSFWCFIF